MRQTIQVARIWGIPIGFNSSWFFIFIFLTWSLAASYIPDAYPNLSQAQYWILGTWTATLFFASVLFHELAHAFFALRYGIGVKQITLFIFGGVAEMEAEPKTPWAEFVIAIAGPVSSFIAAGFFYAFTIIPGLPVWLEAPLVYLMNINLILAIFNLIPGFPLDGGRVLRAIVWYFTNFRRATKIASFSGYLFAAVFFGVGIYMIVSGNIFNGLWLLFIGWFLNNAASSYGSHIRVQENLTGVKVSDIMQRQWEEVDGNLPVSKLYNEHILQNSPRYFFVRINGYGYEQTETPHGMLTLTDVMEMKPTSWKLTPVQTVMTTWNNLIKTDADAPLDEAVNAMMTQNLKQMPVTQDGALVGVLTRDNVKRFLTMRMDHSQPAHSPAAG